MCEPDRPDRVESSQGPPPAENRFELVITAEAEVVRAGDDGDGD